MIQTDSDGVRILVVDDDEDMRDYLRLALTQADRELVTCASPAEVPDEPWSLALLDVLLDGPGLLSLIQGLTEKGVPVVLITGLSEASGHVQAARKAGAVGLLPKPFSLTSLRGIVTRYLAY